MKKKTLIIVSTIIILIIFSSIIFIEKNEEENIICPHTDWTEGVCDGCGIRCSHVTFRDGVCTLCGYTCEAHEWQDGVCVICSTKCPDHRFNPAGKCGTCGMLCSHANMDPERGICLDCGGNCQHLDHDASGHCIERGAVTGHSFINGVCRCGEEIFFECDWLPDTLFIEAEHKGTVERVSYPSHTYCYGPGADGNYPETGKIMSVYLPYGYSDNNKYNVLLVMGGSYADDTYYLRENAYYGKYRFGFPTLYDNMIEQGLCEPVIIVGISAADGKYTSRMTGSLEQLRDQLAPELRYDILPYIAEHYSTWAEDGTEESLTAARTHFGIAGASMGSITMFNAAFASDYDLFSWYGGISGGHCSVDYIKAQMGDNNNLPLSYLYLCAGDSDMLHAQTVAQYAAICEDPDLPGTMGKNAVYTDIIGAGHSDKVWVNGIYNCLRMFFSNNKN